ncbi:Stonustoxin subunit alpha [Acipenser ruthenus]|uniref:Stonustoxin subunit alpha n=1 Tax=Acipenser ruthenus TaxID=7906 RepID=A0A444USI7_ACIRT|nr:Stonustoxin subunit alpha [Acipenser ruthenus]
MATVGDETLEMAALGRPFQLGMLYDCRKDRLIPGITLWDLKELKNETDESSQRKTEFSVSTSDSIEEKASALKVDASLKASLLGGLVEVDGAAKYFKDTQKSTRQSRVTLQYHTTTRFENLTMKHLGKGNVSHSSVFEDNTATHVVTAVLYGAQAYFVFDREVSSEEKQQKIQGEMELAINKIPTAKGAIDLKDKEMAGVEKFKCKFYGDFQLGSNPSTFQDAINAYTTLPKLLGKKGEHAVPVKVWLYPLIKLDSKAAKLVRNIRSDLVTSAQMVLEQLNAAEMQSNDILKDTIVTKFPEVINKIQKLKQRCIQYKLDFMSKLSVVLPSIRGGKKKQESVVEILKNHEESPFNSKALSAWLGSKEREIRVVNSFINQLKDIEVVSSINELDQKVLDQMNENIVCFTFTSLYEHEPYLLELKEYLKTPISKYPQRLQRQDSKPWVCTDTIQKIKMTLKVFQELVDINRENKKTKFFIASKEDQEFPGACILLYENGSFESTYFKTPSKPDIPEVCSVTHDSVSLKTVPSSSDADQKLKWCLEYKCINQKKWAIQFVTDKTETFTVSGLLPNTKYEFRYTVEDKLGYTVSSDTTCSVKTYPASSPGHPSKYQVTPSSITITWKKPTVLGDAVTVCNYRIEYREEGQKQNEANSWLEMRTEDEGCQFTVEDLKDKTPYRIRVSCDCGKDGISSASNEVVIETLLKKMATELIMDNQVATLIKQGIPSIYRLCLKDETPDNDGFFHKASFGHKMPNVQNKTILILGEAGSGKTTLINGMINYILGVEWGDDFRFKLIHEETSKTQAEGPTSRITFYEIHHQKDFAIPFSLTIIDTPGIGDAKGITQDKQIADKIQEIFTGANGIHSINAVCFVVQATLARLTHGQKYIFDSILSMFGKDIKENIQILVTFADGKVPSVLEVFKDSGVPCPKRNDGTPVHFKYNNSVLFACGDNTENISDRMLWKMGFSSMRNMFDELGKKETNSLQLTKEVIAERKKFEAALLVLQPVIKVCLMKLDEMRNAGQDPEQHNWENQTEKDYQEYENLEKQYGRETGVKMDGVQIIQKSLNLIKQLSKSYSRLQEIALWPNLLSAPGYNELIKISQKEVVEAGVELLGRWLSAFDTVTDYCHLTLDTNTVSSDLLLSEGNRKVTGDWGSDNRYPDHPERFDSEYQVLCTKGLSGARFYWEAEWSADAVEIGVTYKTINRKEFGYSHLGRNDKSWCLRYSHTGYSAWHNDIKTKVKVKKHPRVGVYLDCPAGNLSFYNISVSDNTMTFLHRFHATFTEPLYPGIGMDFMLRKIFSSTVKSLTFCDLK